MGRLGHARFAVDAALDAQPAPAQPEQHDGAGERHEAPPPSGGRANIAGAAAAMSLGSLRGARQIALPAYGGHRALATNVRAEGTDAARAVRSRCHGDLQPVPTLVRYEPVPGLCLAATVGAGALQPHAAGVGADLVRGVRPCAARPAERSRTTRCWRRARSRRQFQQQRHEFPLGEVPTVLNSDAPVHTRLRAIVSNAFTPRVIEGLRGRIEEITGELLDDAPAGEPFDLVQMLALAAAGDGDRGTAWRAGLGSRAVQALVNLDRRRGDEPVQRTRDSRVHEARLRRTDRVPGWLRRGASSRAARGPHHRARAGRGRRQPSHP